ncbi:MAG: CHRD domain-containing protein [Rhizobiales bacterium]|nr:CHRD domain-containing protein [Hyphomicrobiales bacterium]
MKTTTLILAGSILMAGTAFARAEMLTFKADMTPGSEVPPAAESKGSGEATVMIDTETKKVTWQTTVKDLTGDATAAHIHGPAETGKNAPPMIDLSAGIMKGEGTVTDQQLADIQAGRAYVNIHTAKYPDGEIRGQLLK